MTRTAQFLIIAAPFIIFAGLLVYDIAPSGVFETRREVGEPSPYVDDFLPEARVDLKEDKYGMYAEIFEDPVYFSVHLPQTDFQTVEVEVEFQNSGHPVVELGALVDTFSNSYDLRPLENMLIDRSDWRRFEGPNVTLLDRTGELASLDAFFDNPPARERVAVYHYEFDEPLRLPEYTPLGHEQVFDVSLRGHHRYATYVKDEPFNLHLTYMDMNRKPGRDDVVLRVFNEAGEVIAERKNEDDGNTTDNQFSSTRTIGLTSGGWPEGVYRVELSGTSDIFWRQIRTTQRYAAFMDRLYPGDEVGHLPDPRPAVFYTNARHLTLETLHAESLQTVRVGSVDVPVEETHKKITAAVAEPAPVRVKSPKGDIKVSGSGTFALTPESYFEPDFVKVTGRTPLDDLGVDYVLTEYRSVAKNGAQIAGKTPEGVKTASAEFALGDIRKENGVAKFVLSIPGIKDKSEPIRVRAVTVRFYKSPLSTRGFFAELRKRLPFGL